MGIRKHADWESTRINTATTTVIRAVGPTLVRSVAILGGTLGDVTLFNAGDVLGENKGVIAGAGMTQGDNYVYGDGLFGIGLTVLTAAATELIIVHKGND